jgi:recombinational DNA repair ATPase RecF
MNNLKLIIENYKLLENLEYDFQSSKVHLLIGQNEVGKTSLLEAIKSLIQAKLDTPMPVTIGKEEGSIIGIFETKKGDSFSVSVEFNTEGKKKYTLIKDGKKSTQVTSIRDLFSYVDVSAEQFLAWSETADGRRKQVDLFLKCLEKDILFEYERNLNKLNKYYTERTPVLSEIALINKILKDLVVTKQDKELYDNKEQLTKEIEETLNHESKYQMELAIYDKAINEVNSFTELYNQKITNINNSINENKRKIKELENAILGLEENKKSITVNYQEKIIDLGSNIPEKPMPIDMNIVNTVIAKKAILNDTIRKVENHTSNLERLNLLNKDKQEYDAKIDLYRDRNKKIISEHTSIDNVFIDDDQLFINTEYGILPFNSNQIATSQQILFTVKLLCQINKDFPIITIGRGESLDANKLQLINQIAEMYDATILVEKVQEGDLKIEILETIN